MNKNNTTSKTTPGPPNTCIPQTKYKHASENKTCAYNNNTNITIRDSSSPQRLEEPSLCRNYRSRLFQATATLNTHWTKRRAQPRPWSGRALVAPCDQRRILLTRIPTSRRLWGARENKYGTQHKQITLAQIKTQKYSRCLSNPFYVALNFN